MTDKLKKLIVDVPDFPTKGVLFKDITPLLQDAEAFMKSVQLLIKNFEKENITKVVGIDSRGFLFAAPAAVLLEAGFVPIRKPGKLPREAFSKSYTCEYAANTLEMHKDALNTGDRVLLIDDVLATGGTAKAAIEMIGNSGAKLIGVSFLLELSFLEGRKQLPDDLPVVSLLVY